jgi:DNA polymerase/3'-5' exonuclease PolX
MTKLTTVPGIGKTFEKDFARIGFHSLEELREADAVEMVSLERLDLYGFSALPR